MDRGYLMICQHGKTSPFVEISLDNIIHNLHQISGGLPPGMGIIAVVKDNGYGCGAVVVSRTLETHGVAFFAVANFPEACSLRAAGTKSPILVLGVCTPDELLWGSNNALRFACTSIDDLRQWSRVDHPVFVHLDIDTGMGRLGIAPSEVFEAINIFKSSPHLICEGLFTHLANADDPDTGAISRQLAHFRKSLNALTQAGLRPQYIHYGNSAAIMRYPLEECTHVRPGIALYGCKPDPTQDFNLDLKPVLSLKSFIVKIKKVPKGSTISYGGTYVTDKDTTISTIAVGYGQGVSRALSGIGSVLLGGKRYGIAGRVTMDFIMVDTGENPSIKVGDEAVIIGCQGTETISPDDVARQCATIAYEILCNISPTIDRYYIHDGKIAHHEPSRPF